MFPCLAAYVFDVHATKHTAYLDSKNLLISLPIAREIRIRESAQTVRRRGPGCKSHLCAF